MRTLLLLTLLTASCASTGWTPEKEAYLKRLRANEQVDVGTIMITAYQAFMMQTGLGLTPNQLEGISQRIDVYWMPESWPCRFHHESRDGKETYPDCSGYYAWEDNRWRVEVAVGECLAETDLLHEFLHILRAETHAGDGDRYHEDALIFEHPDGADVRYSAEWLAGEAIHVLLGCEK